MAVKASNFIPAQVYDRAKRTCWQLKLYCDGLVADWSVNGTDANGTERVQIELNGFWTKLKEAKQTPGIGQYAKDQEDDPTYDVVGEFNALLGLVESCSELIMSAAPRGANSWLETRRYASDLTGGLPYPDNTQLVPRTYSVSQAQPLIDALQAISDQVV